MVAVAQIKNGLDGNSHRELTLPRQITAWSSIAHSDHLNLHLAIRGLFGWFGCLLLYFPEHYEVLVGVVRILILLAALVDVGSLEPSARQEYLNERKRTLKCAEKENQPDNQPLLRLTERLLEPFVRTVRQQKLHQNEYEED